MTKRIHIIAGVATVVFTLVPAMSYVSRITEVSAPTALCGIIGGYIGSFCPDLDYPKGLARRSDRSLNQFERDLKYNHRGWLHTLIIPIILLIINVSQRINSENWITSPIIGLLGLLDGIIIGYTVHLFADMFTTKGIKIGFPFYRKAISFTKFKVLLRFGYFQGQWLAAYLFVLFILYAITYSVFL